MKDLLEKLNIDQLSEMQEEMVEKTKGNPPPLVLERPWLT